MRFRVPGPGQSFGILCLSQVESANETYSSWLNHARAQSRLRLRKQSATHPAANLNGQRAEEAAQLFAAFGAEAGEDPEEV